jgi:hypothetical protein
VIDETSGVPVSEDTELYETIDAGDELASRADGIQPCL